MEKIKSNIGETVAIVIRNDFKKDGINFITENSSPLQLGINSYKKNSAIKTHVHQDRPITISQFQEVIFIKSGKVTVKLYDSQKAFLKSTELTAGDLIFFASGGHGFEILEDTTIIEVKQGPYLGKSSDKVIIGE